MNEEALKWLMILNLSKRSNIDHLPMCTHTGNYSGTDYNQPQRLIFNNEYGHE